MKKKRKLVKKTSSKSKWYKSNTTWMVVGIALFVISIFALGFANNPSSVSTTGNVITGHSVIGDFFTGWNKGTLDISIAKYLLWFIVLLLIYSVLNMTGLFGGTISFFVALIVSFLSMAYLTPDELFVIVATYSALGLTLSVIIPFIILLFSTAVMLSPFRYHHNRTKEDITYDSASLNPFRMAVISVLWLTFLGFMIYKDIVFYKTGMPFSGILGIVMIVITVISLFMLFFGGKLVRRLMENWGLSARKAETRIERKLSRT